MKTLISWACVFLPLPLKLWLYRHLFGYRIGRDARIGLSFVHVGYLDMQDGATIGNFNLIKGIPEVSLGAEAHIGSYNYISSVARPKAISKGGAKPRPRLTLGCSATITSRHYFDVADSIEIGDYATIAGKDSQFWTHEISVQQNRQVTGAISIGAYCLVGSSVRFVANSGTAIGTVVGAGAVVAGLLSEPYCLVGGVPAAKIKTLDSQSPYFLRKDAAVHW